MYGLLDYSKVRPRSTANLPSLRAHRSVLVRPDRTDLNVPGLISRARDGDDGGNVVRDLLKGMANTRLDHARRRRCGESVVLDETAEGLSFAHVRNLKALQQRLDFDVQVTVQEGESRRNITTSLFALLTGTMATADVQVAYEGVPTVTEMMVQELDDDAPNTEIPEILDFPHSDPTEVPVALGETAEYHEVGAGEERYTILTFRDGYQRAFSQKVIDHGGPRVFSELMDLGKGAREWIEMFTILKLIDYHGSKSTSATWHVMNRERAPAALFSSTANTPSTRTPSGTRINNNALVDTTDVENLRARLAGMRNSRGFPIANWPELIFVPDALWLKAFKILNSTGEPGIYNEVNAFGPDGMGPPIQLVSSPMLDLLTTTAWYGGRPRMQFVRKWAERPEVAVFGGVGTEPYLRTREGMRVRIGWDMTVGVRSHTYWVECLSATTAPGG